MVIRRNDVRQYLNVVASASSPRDLSEIQVVGNPIVGERCKPMLIDRIQQAEFCSNAVVKPMKYGQPVATLRRSGQAKHLAWLERAQYGLERDRGTMMKHDDYDNIEKIPWD